MNDDGKALPAERRSAEVEDFLRQVRRRAGARPAAGAGG